MAATAIGCPEHVCPGLTRVGDGPCITRVRPWNAGARERRGKGRSRLHRPGYDGAACCPGTAMSAAPVIGPTMLLQRGDYGVTGGGSGALNRAQITEPEFTCPDIGDGISIVFGRRTVYETWVLPEPGVS